MTEDSKSKSGVESTPLVNHPDRNQVKKEDEEEKYFSICSKAAWRLLCHNEELERSEFGSIDRDKDDKVDELNFGMCWPPRCKVYPGTTCKYTYQGFPIFILATSIVQASCFFMKKRSKMNPR